MKRFLTLGVAVAVTLISCVDGGEQTTSPTGDAPIAVTSNTSSVQTNQPEDAKDREAKQKEAKEKFHERNYADWVGKAHNDALGAFFAQLALDGGSRNVCSMIVHFMSDAARIPHGKKNGSDAQRRRLVSLGLQGTGCAPDVAQFPESPRLAFANVLTAYQSGSPELNARLDEIKYAAWIAPTSGDLAISLNDILTRADLLPAAESELAYAAASVAQWSYEDWEANLVPRTGQVQVTYGPCLGGYSTGDAALINCMGIGGTPIQPTRGDELHEPLRVRFASSMQQQRVCYRGRNEIIASDVAGGIIGAIGGSILGPGALIGGLGGAAGASGTTGITYMGLYVHCRLTGGASDRDAKPLPQ